MKKVIWVCLAVVWGCGPEQISSRAHTAAVVSSHSPAEGGDYSKSDSSSSWNSVSTLDSDFIEGAGDFDSAEGAMVVPSNDAVLGGGGGDSSLVVRASDLSEIVHVTAGMGHTCALTSKGTVFCWGANHAGQLGLGYVSACQTLPKQVMGVSDAVFVSTGGVHTCILLRDGRVLCFGSNEFGQLGSNAPAVQATPAVIDGLPAIQYLASTTAQTCAITDTSEIFCWGINAGAETEPDSGLVSVRIPAPVQMAHALSIGDRHLCVLMKNGLVFCRGNNEYGQVFGRNETPVQRFKQVPGIHNARQVVSGNDHNCALLRNGRVSCWGINLLGETQPQSNASTFRKPVPIRGLGFATQLSAAPSHTCALTKNRQVVCWGPIYALQLGVDVEDIRDDTPLVPLPDLTNAIAVSTGNSHTCVVFDNGHIRCFGNNDYGQLGNGTPDTCSTRDPLPNNLGRREGQPGRHSIDILMD